MINFELYWDSTEITSNVIDYTREHNICTGIGLVSFTVSLADTNNYTTWDLIEPYENNIKKGKFYISEIEENAPKGSITIRCQDSSKRLVDYFLSNMYEIADGDWSGAWLETILNEAGVSYSINSAGSGVRLPAHSIGYDAAYSLVMTLLQQSGWYMYFDANGTAQIGNLDRDGSVQETYDTTEIIKISVDKNDKILRNKAIVYGNQLQAVEEVTTKWNYDDADDRTVVVASPYIRDIGTAQGIASRLLDEFARLSIEKQLDITGFRDVYIGETVKVQSNIFNGNGKITSINVRMSDKGATTTLVLDERCPRLFTYWSPYYEGVGTYVYCGTWGDGVHRKPISSDTWEAYNTGLTDLYVRDLYVKDGNLVVVANNGFAYRRQDTSPAWLRIWHDDFVASGVGTYLEQDVKARACTINEDNELVVGLRDSAGEYSWVYTLDVFGNDIAREQVITSGSDSHRLYDIASYGARENIISTEVEGEIVTSSGIMYINVNGQDYPCMGSTDYSMPFHNIPQYQMEDSDIYTSWVPAPDSGDDLVDGTDFNFDSVDASAYSTYYLSYNEYPSDTRANDLIVLHEISGTGGYVLHKKITPSGIYDKSSYEFWGFTGFSNESSLYYDRPNDDYYILMNYDYNINSSYGVRQRKVIDGVDSGSYTSWSPSSKTTYIKDPEQHTRLNDKFYAYGESGDYFCVVEIDMVTFDFTYYEVQAESGAYDIELSPLLKNGDGWIIYGSYKKASGGYITWRGFSYDGTTKTLTGTLETSIFPNYVEGFPTQHTTTYLPAGMRNRGMITSVNNDGTTLLISNSSWGNFNDGTLKNYASHFYMYVDENGTITSDLIEDEFTDYTAPQNRTLNYGTDYKMTFAWEVVGLSSRKKPRMFVERDYDDDLTLNFYDPSDRSLINSADLDDAGKTLNYIKGISPTVDFTDQSLYIKMDDDGTDRIWGISYPDGTLVKETSDMGIGGTAGSLVDSFQVIMNMAITEDDNGYNYYQFYDYTIPSGTSTSTPTFSSDIIRHKNENFGIVLNTSKLSKVEISKNSPTIVYNPASGILSTDLYYSYKNAEDTFSGIMTLGNLNDLRVFDANFSGGAGLDENYFRYIGYVMNDGIYARTMPSGTPALMTTFSGVGNPSKIEIANYGVNPYMFVATTSPQKFYQRDPYSGYTFEDKSISLPSGAVTIIRLDDRL
jgi:hypothetical protein